MELPLDLPRFRFDRNHPLAVSPLRPGHQGSECFYHSLSLPSGIRSLHSRSFRSREGPGLARRHGDDLREIVPTENGRDRQTVAALPLTSLVPILANIDGTTLERSIHQEGNISALRPASRLR